MTSCPNCGKPVDPLRSRNVSVRTGKVVAYCSAECQAAQETRPVAVPTKSLASFESGPVIEIVSEPTGGVVTAAAAAKAAAEAEKKGGKKKKAVTPIAVAVVAPPTDSAPDAAIAVGAGAKQRAASEPAEQWAKNAELIKADAYVRIAKPRRGVLIAVLVSLIAAGVAVVAYRMVSSKSTSEPSKPPDAKPVPGEPAAPGPGSGGGSAAVVKPADPEPPALPMITIPAALDKAKAGIAKNLRAESPLVQRLAAAALARGGDRASSEFLVVALKTETSDLSKLKIAYALARGGDQRGITALMQNLAAPNKDPKQWAAEQLVRLAANDADAVKKPETQKAIEALAPSLTSSAPERLAEAELLGPVGDARAIKVLDQIRSDAAATPEAKARATIALGLSGRGDATAGLRDLMNDGSWSPFAAAALAHLHDASAKPALVSQLATKTQRVRAARALRELEPKLDPAPLLPPLLAALDATKDAEQVEVGEAILVLCGPAAWAQRE